MNMTEQRIEDDKRRIWKVRFRDRHGLFGVGAVTDVVVVRADSAKEAVAIARTIAPPSCTYLPAFPTRPYWTPAWKDDK